MPRGHKVWHPVHLQCARCETKDRFKHPFHGAIDGKPYCRSCHRLMRWRLAQSKTRDVAPGSTISPSVESRVEVEPQDRT